MTAEGEIMASESMASAPLALPVLPLDDEVVLPGMVVPLDLSDNDVRAAVEAAQAAARPGGG
ncbi:LON peptidase substrate-binding domain-containing protein, partial [Streptomyces cinereoruber]|uniref:LON peptidase substrate-binding domain-containing protein n=1 Tax=Streptomyces cinereoruber TaxID=67260 RepID=UPI00362D0EC5